MAKELGNIDLESQHNDKCPLLNDPTSSPKSEGIFNAQTTRSTSSPSIVENIDILNNSISVSSTQNEVIFSGMIMENSFYLHLV